MSALLTMSLSLLLIGCTPSERKIQGETMGTTFRVTIEGNGPDPTPLIRHRLDELEQLFSNWRSDSAVSRWNASRSTGYQPVPREVAEVVSIALECARDTDGALDVTIAPLIDLWGFGPAKPDHLPPTYAEIQSAREHTGWQKLEVKLDPPLLRKTDPLLTINLSTLVEGYASDTLADLLQSQGYTRVLVDVGGAITARGKVWQIAIQEPGSAFGEALTTVPLHDESVTTAGTYRKHFEKAGHEFSHILDPRTGRPVDHSLISVSVFSKRAVIADGYDTGLLVLGPQAGRETAKRLGLRTVFVERASR